MIYVGMDLHRKNSYLAAISSHGEAFPPRRIYHYQIEDL